MENESSLCRSAAAIQHRHRLIELLLSRGADPNVGASGRPAWGKLLLAVANANLLGSSLQTLSQTITAFLSHGADPRPPKVGKYRGITVWTTFLEVFLSAYRTSKAYKTYNTIQLELFSKICCAMLSHGADPAMLSKEDVSRFFPLRLALPILDLIDEKGGGKAVKEKEKEKDKKNGEENEAVEETRERKLHSLHSFPKQAQWNYWNPWTWFESGT